MNSTLDPSTIELARRLDVQAALATVVSSTQISSSLREVVLKAEPSLAGVPGNDLMIRVPAGGAKFVRRRYSVRDVDPDNGLITLWTVSTHQGPGAQWSREASAGDVVEVVGPRGKISLSEVADWHLLMGDVSGLGSFYRMAQHIEVPGRAIFIVELDFDDDMLTTAFDEGLGVTAIFVDRNERLKSDPAGLLSGLAAFAFPPDEGHAYLFGEFHVMRVLRAALLDRGLGVEQISSKAFWRAGQVNGENGEPSKADD